MTPRLLRRVEVMRMLGISSSTLHRWRESGLIPPPLPGTARYDREAIEAALDRARGQQGTSTAPTLAERATRWAKSA